MLQNSVVSALPYLLSILVSIFASFLADWIITNEMMSIANTRKVLNTVAFWVPGVALITMGYSGCDRNVVIFLLCLSSLSGITSSSFAINLVDIAPNFAGAVMGLCNGMGNIMGFVAPIITGQIIKNDDDMYHWTQAFTIGGIVLIVGNICYLALASGYQQPWDFAANQCQSQARRSARRRGDQPYY